MNADRTRARLAIIALLGTIAAMLLLFWHGKGLGEIQVALLTLAIREVAGRATSAFAYYFDGTPHQQRPAAPPAAPTPAPKEPAP